MKAKMWNMLHPPEHFSFRAAVHATGSSMGEEEGEGGGGEKEGTQRRELGEGRRGRKEGGEVGRGRNGRGKQGEKRAEEGKKEERDTAEIIERGEHKSRQLTLEVVQQILYSVHIAAEDSRHQHLFLGHHTHKAVASTAHANTHARRGRKVLHQRHGNTCDDPLPDDAITRDPLPHAYQELQVSDVPDVVPGNGEKSPMLIYHDTKAEVDGY